MPNLTLLVSFSTLFFFTPRLPPGRASQAPRNPTTDALKKKPAEFTSFFEHCQLETLDLRSGTADLARIVSSFGPLTCSSLLSLSFSTTGYLSHRLQHALLGLPALQHLTLHSIQFDLTPTFFATLSPLPLQSVNLLGPHGLASRSAFLRVVREFVEGPERPVTLEELGVDVAVPPSRSPSPVHEMDTEGHARAVGVPWRGFEEARTLDVVCRANGVMLKGTIREALDVKKA